MTPTNTDTAAKVYSKRFIAGLTRQLAALTAFSLDLNQEAKQVGETIQVPLVGADTAAAWNDTTNNFARTTATLGDREQPPGQTERADRCDDARHAVHQGHHRRDLQAIQRAEHER